MNQSNLFAEQWQKIAEKLAENLKYGCSHMHCEEECGLLCPMPKSMETMEMSKEA